MNELPRSAGSPMAMAGVERGRRGVANAVGGASPAGSFGSLGVMREVGEMIGETWTFGSSALPKLTQHQADVTRQTAEHLHIKLGRFPAPDLLIEHFNTQHDPSKTSDQQALGSGERAAQVRGKLRLGVAEVPPFSRPAIDPAQCASPEKARIRPDARLFSTRLTVDPK